MVASTTTQLFPTQATKLQLPGTLSQLPPIQFRGPVATAPATPSTYNLNIEHSVLTWNALGTLIFEAIADSSILVKAYVLLEININHPSFPRATAKESTFQRLFAIHHYCVIDTIPPCTTYRNFQFCKTSDNQAVY